MMTRKYIALGLVIFSLAIAGAVLGKQWVTSAGQAEEDTSQFLQKLLDANLPGHKYYAQEGEMLLIDATQDKDRVIEQRNFKWWYGADLTACHLDSVLLVQDSSQSIQVDQRQEQILVMPIAAATAKQWSLGEILKSLEDMNARMEVGTEGDLKVLTVDSLSIPEFQGYRIFVDPQSYEVKKILVGMNRLQPLDDNEVSAGEDEFYTYFLEIRYTARRMISRTEMPKPDMFVRADPSAPGQFIPSAAYQRYRMLAQSEVLYQEINETE